MRYRLVLNTEDVVLEWQPIALASGQRWETKVTLSSQGGQWGDDRGVPL